MNNSYARQLNNKNELNILTYSYSCVAITLHICLYALSTKRGCVPSKKWSGQTWLAGPLAPALGTMDLHLHSNCLSCEKTGSPRLMLVDLTAGRLIIDFKIFKILYRLNYLEFYFVDQCNVINTVRSAFQSAFLKQSVF